jgi:hypothetical protein
VLDLRQERVAQASRCHMAARSGRGRWGRLRNFDKMGLVEFIPLVQKVRAEDKDPKAIAAVNDQIEARIKEFSEMPFGAHGVFLKALMALETLRETPNDEGPP